MSPGGRPTRSTITEVALELLGNADLEELTRVLTPERLSASGAGAASTVRYHFGGEVRADGTRDLGFGRRELALEVVRLALERANDALAATAGDDWQETLRQMAAAGSIDPAREALARHVQAFVPGGAVDDAGPRDRARLLAYAVADQDPEVARLLREDRSHQVDHWTASIEQVLAAARRVPVEGRTTREIADAVLTIVEGHLARLRIEAAASDGWLADLVIGTIERFTRPIDG